MCVVVGNNNKCLSLEKVKSRRVVILMGWYAIRGCSGSTLSVAMSISANRPQICLKVINFYLGRNVIIYLPT